MSVTYSILGILKKLVFSIYTNSSPSDGEVWYDSAGLWFRRGGNSRNLTGQWETKVVKGSVGSAGLTGQSCSLLSKTSSNLIGLGDQTNVIRYNGTTPTITAHGATGNANMTLAARSGGTVIIQTAGNSVWRYSTDHGATWNNTSGGTTGLSGGVMCPGGENGSSTTWIYATGTSGQLVYKSTNDGQTWSSVSGAFATNLSTAGIANNGSFGGSQVWILLSTTGIVRQSTDDGATWVAATTMGNLSAGTGKFINYINGYFVALDNTGGGLIYYSPNTSTAWTSFKSPSMSQSAGIFYDNGMYIFIDTSGMIYTCPDITASSPDWSIPCKAPSVNQYCEVVPFSGKYYTMDTLGSSNLGSVLFQYIP